MEISNLESVLWFLFKLNCLAIGLVIIYDRLLKPYVVKPQAEEAEATPEESVLKYFDTSQSGAADSATTEPALRRISQRENESIGTVLLQSGLVDKITLQQAVAHTKKYGGNLAQCLLKFGYVDEKDIARCLSKQLGVPYLSPEAYDVSQDIIDLIPAETARKHWLVPLDKNENVLTVAMTDPLAQKLIDKLEEQTGLTIMPFVSIISEIVTALEKYYHMEIRTGSSRMPPFLINTSYYSGEERRDCLRFQIPVACRFTLEDTVIKSETLDISTGGFLLSADRPVDAKTILTLELNPPAQVSPLPMTAVVEVVRCEPHTDYGYYLAVKTRKIEKDDLNLLIQYALEQDLDQSESHLSA